MKSWAGAAAMIVMSLAAAAQAQSGNAGRGERVFNQQCKTCHSLEKDGSSVTGPDLARPVRSQGRHGGGFRILRGDDQVRHRVGRGDR